MKIKWPIKAEVTSKFGPRKHPVTGELQRHHNGIDIWAVIGTDVKCPADGTVTDYYFHKFGGWTMIVVHDNKLESRFAHLQREVAKVGQKVKEGEVIAKSGNTGRSSGPHLHFGVKNEKGEYIDPLTVLA